MRSDCKDLNAVLRIAGMLKVPTTIINTIRISQTRRCEEVAVVIEVPPSVSTTFAETHKLDAVKLANEPEFYMKGLSSLYIAETVMGSAEYCSAGFSLWELVLVSTNPAGRSPRHENVRPFLCAVPRGDKTCPAIPRHRAIASRWPNG